MKPIWTCFREFNKVHVFKTSLKWFLETNLLSSLGWGLASEERHYIQKMWKINTKNKPHRVSIDFRKAANESLRWWFVLFLWADGYKLVSKNCQPCTVYPTELLNWNWQVCALIRASLWCKDKSLLTVFDVMQHSTEEHKRKEHPDYGAVNVTVAVLMSVLSIFLMLQASPHWGNIYTEMQINAVSSSRRVLTVGGAITATGPAWCL